MTPNSPILIIVSGLPRHGKTTLAGLLSTFTGLPYGDCSYVIYEALAAKENTTITELRSRDKNKLRADLIATGDALCDGNPSYLVDTLVDRGISIIPGVRKPDELAAIRAKHDNVIHIWVEAFDTQAQAERFLTMGGQGTEVDPDAESVYSAPTIHDNTDAALRDAADYIVFNPTMSYLVETARFLASKYV